MSINLPYVESNGEELQGILSSQKQVPFSALKTLDVTYFVNQNTKQLQKIKNSIIYKIDCSNCKIVYFGESKRSLKSCSDEYKRSVENYDYKKNETTKHFWEADHNFRCDQRSVVDKENRYVPRRIKETISYLRNPYHGNKISYMLPEVWRSNLRQFLVSYPLRSRRF